MPDYIVVGQGICGTFLSYYLQKAGKSVCVIDIAKSNTASKIASGIINPVTGRRLVKTWLIDELLPFAWNAYNALGKELSADLIRQCDVLDFFATPQMKEVFTSRMEEEKNMLSWPVDDTVFQKQFRFNYGVGKIEPCYLTDVQNLLCLWRERLIQNNLLSEETFDWNFFSKEKEGIKYKDITAEKIIFCNGVGGASNPYFHMLPFAFNKGEALLVSIPELPPENIYKQGISIVPWKEKNMFWVGSNYLWQYDDLQPTTTFRKRTEELLSYWLKLPFKTEAHVVSERPATVERRPFVGLHPVHSSIGILNGMGTKGCSLAPYFAYQLAQHLTDGFALDPLADIKRFTRILSR